jgi:hypothetical protein
MKGFNALTQKLMQHQTVVFFVLTFITGLIVLSPYTDYQGLIAPGDIGRDFYAFEQTLNGQVPYQDYWWVYGPLMPYYYAIFLKLLGVTASSVLIGKIVLQFGAGLLLYLGLRSLIHPAFAYLAAGWFLVFHEGFFFTYNHAGGIFLIVGCVFCLLRYVSTNNLRYLWWGIAIATTLSFVKLNFGLAALFLLVVSTFITDLAGRRKLTRTKKIFYAVGILVPPLLITAVYWLFLQGLTLYEIRQCLPYLGADHPNNTTLSNAIAILARTTWNRATSDWTSATFFVLVLGSAIRTIYLFLKRKLDPSRERTTGLALIILSIYYGVNLHEFLMSGVWYRTVWSQPLIMMLSFVFLYAAVSPLPRRWQAGLWIVLLGLVSLGFYTRTSLIGEVKRADHSLSYPKADVYLSNSSRWIETVEETTDFLSTNLKEDELFFALPYDPLYYYLTDKTSPTRQIIFFDHINIPSEQEEKIISELESKNVGYVLISSRQNSGEPGLGILGQTYCPLIAQYINANFEQVAQFGDWENPPGWAWNHGTAILKRRDGG